MTPQPSRRRAWKNHTGNQRVEPLAIYTPESVEDLVWCVQQAERDGVTVRAVGSGHSWSDVALGTGYLLKPNRLCSPLDLEESLLRVPGEDLVRVEAGMTIRGLNSWLAGRDLALINMGGYDAQTVAGVISTSTHGSGIEFGPLCDFVRSMDMIAAGGKAYRIEPEDGPTDPSAWDPQRGELVQDDGWFDAALVGMGCLGLIYAVILQVRPRYLLTERRWRSSWEDLREEVSSRSALAEYRHFELYLNPYEGDDGRHLCMVTTREPATTRPSWLNRAARRNLLAEAISSLPFTGLVIDAIATLLPHMTPRFLGMALRGLADDEYTNDSYKVLNIGAANLVPAYSSEIGVPLAHAAEAVDRILAIADRHRRLGDVFHTAPIALRFVKASRASMSMMEGRDTMMIELIQLKHTEGGMELLAAYEEALYELDGRPHWGQVNTLTGSHRGIERLYPRYADWLAVHDTLNAGGVFGSPFSKRVGISGERARA